jgi:hypothetical protein
LCTASQVDNFTYLCLCNRTGGRSLSDYTEYFVFPWIVSNLEATLSSDPSRTPSVLSHSRLARSAPNVPAVSRPFTKTQNTSTSTGRITCIDPFCLFSLHLQLGWAHPNRVFRDLQEIWTFAAITFASEVKALIPEFFWLSNFLSSVSLGCLRITDEFVRQMQLFSSTTGSRAAFLRGST